MLLPRISVEIRQPSIVYELSAEAALALPRPANFTSSSLLPTLTARLGSAASGDEVWVYSVWAILLMAVTSAVILVWLASRWREQRWIAVALLFAVPALPFMAWSDPYSMWLILGLAWVGLSRTRAQAMVGALIASLGHSEQAMAALVALWIVSRSNWLSLWKRRANGALIVAVLVYLAFQVWFLSNGFRDVRTWNLLVLGQASIKEHFTSDWPSLAFSLYGILWALVLIVLIGTRPRIRSALLLCTGLVLVPLAAGFFTLDGSRVLIPIGTSVLMATLSVLWEEKVPTKSESRGITGLLGILAIVQIAVFATS